MSDKVEKIKSVEDFKKKVMESSMPIVVDFWAEWCMPCRMMSPVLEELAKEMENIKFYKVNVDKVTELARRFGVMSIPTFVVFKDGREAGRIVGAMPKQLFRQQLERILGEQ